MNLFQLGEFQLASHYWSDWRIDCDALSDEDIECIARLLRTRLPAFGSVEGVPTGGNRLAEAMEKYITAGPLLIVDDVWTTGGSMHRHRDGRAALGAVIFARNPVEPWVTALFQMPPNV